jgi:hypothetical protein
MGSHANRVRTVPCKKCGSTKEVVLVRRVVTIESVDPETEDVLNCTIDTMKDLYYYCYKCREKFSLEEEQ